jgi:hypothetical protein
MNQAHRVALFCWAAPLIVGVIEFFVWVKTREPVLMAIGTAILFAGTALFFFGMIALMRGHAIAAESIRDNKPSPWGKTALITLLLLTNFPIAGAIIFAAIEVQTSYSVVVHNKTTNEIEDCRLEMNGRVERFGKITAGATASRTFWIRGDGSLIFVASINGVQRRETIDEYVTNSLGGRKMVTIEEDFTISVIDLKHD